MRKIVVFYFFLFFVGMIFVGSSVFTTYSQFVAEGPLTQKTEIVIPKGKSVKQIAKLLKEKNIIHSPTIFELGIRASGNSYKVQAGEYSIPAGASAKMVMNILTSGNTYIRSISIPEGLSSHQIFKIIDEAAGLEGSLPILVPQNGTLLPETYHYSYGDTKESIVVRMQNAMKRAILENCPKDFKNLPFSSCKEAIILASVVEKETALDKERPLIAGVFMNRLRQHMKLQSDPTVIYALTEGKEDLKRRLTFKDLKTNHPCNTYVIPGIPKEAISNPGLASIQAVLHPANTDALYFVADGTGGHIFSKTFNEHKKNVASWYKIRNNKNKTLEKPAPQGNSNQIP